MFFLGKRSLNFLFNSIVNKEEKIKLICLGVKEEEELINVGLILGLVVGLVKENCVILSLEYSLLEEVLVMNKVIGKRSFFSGGVDDNS